MFCLKVYSSSSNFVQILSTLGSWRRVRYYLFTVVSKISLSLAVLFLRKKEYQDQENAKAKTEHWQKLCKIQTEKA